MIQINGDSYGNIELTPGQSWVVPDIAQYVQIVNARWIDSSHAFVHIYIGNEQYGIPITQRVWYDVGGIKFNADVQIRNKRVNHIMIQVPDSWVASQLEIQDISIELDPIGDIPEHNRSGIALTVNLYGDGSKNLKINWGTDHSETKLGLTGTSYTFYQNLPVGTHNICAELF